MARRRAEGRNGAGARRPLVPVHGIANEGPSGRFTGGRNRLRAAARLSLVFALPAFVIMASVAACSSRAKHRVLTFFFDGVPDPSAASSAPAAGGTGADYTATDAAQPSAVPVYEKYFVHAPYRDNHCRKCHDGESGQLIRRVDEGLCLTCHGKLVSEVRYVHGPVAVNQCDFCHHHHAAKHPALLLRSAGDTCRECHDVEDLTAGAHHSGIAAQSCVLCHDPHGGGDRFFLKRSTP